MAQPTQVQAQTIPLILQNKDVLARAKTGSGKTAAFAIPIINELTKDPYGKLIYFFFFFFEVLKRKLLYII